MNGKREWISVFDFPDPRAATPEGLVAVGGQWSAELLESAYKKGIFPWPQEGLPILWFSPDPRGVLDFDEFHVPRSLQKFARKCPWIFTLNRAFESVMQECRKQKRPGQDGTWILPEMIPAYSRLHLEGKALSLECWEDGVLIGGIYGVLVNGVFSGESMFYARPNASKMCFWKLVEHLKSQGQTWMDLQMVTEATAAFGGKYIAREEFLNRRGV